MLINLLVFLVVLGLLIFFHELGHFLAAKACGIYCDRFSLGMPPRVWGFRWGETDYCIGALPIGGYVKMAGQEDAPLSEEEREKEYGHVPPERFYTSKPVWQRAIVIAAGPLMNLVLAFVLYGLVPAVGAEVPETKVDSRIGAVQPDSPAAKAPMFELGEGQTALEASLSGEPATVGWQTGDRILTLDGRAVRSIKQDLQIDAMLGGGRQHILEIARVLPDGRTVRYASPVVPKSFGGTQQTRYGVAAYTTALVGKVLKDGAAERAGLQPGDIVVQANGQSVDSETLKDLVEATVESERVQLEVLRGDSRVQATLTPTMTGSIGYVVFDPPLHSDAERDTIPAVGKIPADVQEATGLKPHDLIVKVNGEPATVAALEKAEHDLAGGKITLEVKRPAVLFGLLRAESTLNVELAVSKVGSMGVTWAPRTVFHRVSPVEILPEAYRESRLALVRTLQTLKMLVVGSDSVKAKDFGGPVLIYQIMARAREMGWNWLLEMMAFVSINLCVFNLLPLPVLDGGQLVFLAIEGVRRKPLSVRLLERVQQAGLVAIVLLLLFVTYNDLHRIFVSIVS